MNRKQRRQDRKAGVDTLLRDAAGHLSAGRLRDAEALCRERLARHPDDGGALHLLGLVAHRAGNDRAAADLLARASAGRGAEASVHRHASMLLNRVGRAAEAEAAARRAVALQPADAEAQAHLGAALRAQGRVAEAAAAYGAAAEADPGNAAAHTNLGAALLVLRDLAGAEEACRRAAALDAHSAGARANLGAVLDAKGDFEGAAEAFRQSVALDPRTVRFRLDLGHVLEHMGRLDEAEEVLGEALAMAPDDADAHRAMGLFLAEVGRADEAVASLRRAIALRPLLTEAYLSLARSGLAEFSEDEMRAMAAAAERPDLGAETRARLHFALGSTHDRNGDVDTAFAHFRAGNRLRRESLATAGLTFDADAHDRLVQRIAETFDGPFFSQRTGWGAPSDVPVFVVGMPRSGTTLVEQILASHGDVHGAGELEYVDATVAGLPGRAGRGGPYPDCVAGLDAETMAALGADYLAAVRRLAPDARRIVDKAPLNFLHLGVVALTVPGARVVHCRRDPRDVGLSCYVQAFQAAHPWSTDLDDIGRFQGAYRRLMEHWRAVLPLPVLEVDYETLVADLEGESRRLIDFLGLPWDPACLTFHQTRRPVRTASHWQVRRPVYGDSVGRWRAYAEWLGPVAPP